MRFARFWDVAVIGQWRSLRNEKAVLTDYCTQVSPKDLERKVDDPWFTGYADMCCGVMNALYFQSNVPELRMHVPRLYDEGKPMRGAFVSAHCLFGRPAIDTEAPVDPKMDFSGDESPVAARLWTHGFDIWHSGARCIYHAYDLSNATAPAHQHDASDTKVDGGITRRERQRRRVEKLFGVYDWPDEDLSGFDLGTERSLQAYQEYCGVDFRRMSILMFAANGLFDRDHDRHDMAVVDWEQVWKDEHGTTFPDQGEKLDVKVRSDAVAGFMAECEAVDLRPQVALTEAIRQWVDNRRRGRSC